MKSNSDFCQKHPQQNAGGIFKGKNIHKTQRKFCIDCILQLQNSNEQILGKEEFVKQLSIKYQQLNVENQLGQSEQSQFFKRMLSKLDNIEKEISLIISSIKESILTIQIRDKEIDNKFLKLTNQHLNPFECSNSELDFLLNFLDENIFEKFIKNKQIFREKIENAGILLDRIVKNLYKSYHLIDQIGMNFTQEQTEDTIICVEGFEGINNRLRQTKFQITKLRNQDKIYQKDGQILRIEKNIIGAKNEEIIFNIEQMKYLEFKGDYGVKGNKIQSWKYFWKGKQIGGGTYNIWGQKIGKWIEISENYWDQKQVLEIGYYQEGKKIGLWLMSLYNQQIGGGSYNEEGNQKKIGKWVELDEGFNTNKKVTYSGEYNLNGQKVGRWDINYCQFQENEYKKILNIHSGGGIYDQEGNQEKIGKWVELDQGFMDDKQATFSGEYNNKGSKVGRWDFKYRKYLEVNFKLIGGGQYDQDGNQEKIGKWVELDEKFSNPRQIIYIGEYKNGMRVGRWDIWFKDIHQNSEFQQTGGGSYDELGDQKKIGKWTELDDKFCHPKQVTHIGEYNINGMKIGKWDILHTIEGGMDYKEIGGGQYDQDGNQKKIGKWVEIEKKFCKPKQIIYIGEYKNGMKVGRWDIWFKDIHKNSEFQQIGGGSYDEFGDQKKIGKWTELDDKFCHPKQVTHIGEYNINVKVGRWDIMHRESENEYNQIGGGLYDQEGDQKKIGKWVELKECSDIFKLVIYSGQYNYKGLKYGKWVEMRRDFNERRFIEYAEKHYQI